MILDERIKKLTTGKREYNRLYKADNLYIVWATKINDSKLLDFVNAINEEYYSLREELRGDTRSQAKVANAKNNSKVLQGFIYSVTANMSDMFEKAALMPSMKYSYRFEKYDLNKIKEQEQQEIIEKLTEENV